MHLSTRRASRPTSTRAASTAALVGAAALALTACTDGESSSEGGDEDAVASATISDPEGTDLGTVDVEGTDGGVQISADLSDLDPGFYGFHVHEIGECEPDSAAPEDPSDTGDFMSAGSHIGAGDEDHPDHPGDLPPLLVTEEGTAELEVTTDRLTEEDLTDQDGAAVMIHSEPDNFANIPDRYSSEGPDSQTSMTGDAGDRIGCGPLE